MFQVRYLNEIHFITNPNVYDIYFLSRLSGDMSYL